MKLPPVRQPSKLNAYLKRHYQNTEAGSLKSLPAFFRKMAGLLTYGGSVAFDEFPGASPKISFDRDKVRIDRSGTIAWDDINAAYAECHPTGLLGRHPSVSYLYVDSVTITPNHPEASQDDCSYSSNVLGYPGQLAKVEISYAPVDFDVTEGGITGEGDDAYLTFNKDFGGEFMTRPTDGLTWWDDAKVQTEDISFVKIVPLIEHSITVHRAPSIPDAAIRANIGKVNAGGWQGADDETMLFIGCKSTWAVTAQGIKSYQIDFRFHERRISDGANVYGWNYYFRNSDGKWMKIKDKDGKYSYQSTGNFDDLFSF